jgi:hypothetical protein
MIAAAAALALLVGCATAPSGPVGLVSIAGEVTGFPGGGDIDVAAVTWPGPTSGATGTVRADPPRLQATFVPLADMPDAELEPIEALFASHLDKGGTCDVEVSNPEARIATISGFRGPGSDRLWLQTYDPHEQRQVDDRTYAFVLATERVTVVGECEGLGGARPERFDLDLVRGWNPVAAILEEVEGSDEGRTLRATEPPVAEALWWYVELVKELARPAAR